MALTKTIERHDVFGSLVTAIIGIGTTDGLGLGVTGRAVGDGETSGGGGAVDVGMGTALFSAIVRGDFTEASIVREAGSY
jgi:hypothetical protein